MTKTPKMAVIVAISSNHVIGRENTMPWHMPADLAHFKKLTMGHVMVMGKNTFRSIGKPLPGRSTWVLSTSMESTPGVRIFRSLQELLNEARKLDQDRFFVVGGGALYSSLLPLAHELYLTEIDIVIDGDTYFPEIDPQKWDLIDAISHPADDKNPHSYTFKFFQSKSGRQGY